MPASPYQAVERDVDCLPVKLDGFLSPGRRISQLLEETVCLTGGEKGRAEEHLGLGEGQDVKGATSGICCQSWHGLTPTSIGDRTPQGDSVIGLAEGGR